MSSFRVVDVRLPARPRTIDADVGRPETDPPPVRLGVLVVPPLVWAAVPGCGFGKVAHAATSLGYGIEMPNLSSAHGINHSMNSVHCSTVISDVCGITGMK